MIAVTSLLQHSDCSEIAGTQALIIVEPVAGGWCMICRGCRGTCEPLVFLSGGRAEAQARELARCLSFLGQDAIVEIHDRENVLAGAARYLAGGPEHFLEGAIR